MDAIISKYGLWAFLSIYLIKSLYEVLMGQTARNTKSLDANTDAINKLRKDLRVAFYNIRKQREKDGMGELESPPEFDQ